MLISTSYNKMRLILKFSSEQQKQIYETIISAYGSNNPNKEKLLTIIEEKDKGRFIALFQLIY